MPYEIQHFTLADGWINTWSDGETGEPTVYDRLTDARIDLRVFLQDTYEAYENGWLESMYQENEFRIVEIKGNKNA